MASLNLSTIATLEHYRISQGSMTSLLLVAVMKVD